MPERINKVFSKAGLPQGRLLSGSKSRYRQLYPSNDIIFNANIFTKAFGKVWHGDVDITFDETLLKGIAKELGEPLYVLYEMDGRFEQEDRPFKEVTKVARFVIFADQIIRNENRL